ncbi:hypothetical protein M409DRAFT_21324 [Zasmidium cellare ATCC 36951]|uniref:NAD(P)-binding domain-containing protein n=1 Tax=Zasmidium cellare ATCC 36951 TaxID=1080233 RepID=A0A6A6CN75_ZASCE|nr:uncharacterized protein M409DRAFT_21324 [Zasmidium cellare ATCC 36951]KAF2168574.1 hypothetical protein M409DRAFT_21324 [Zasmidium cellare ATCC 36951]
MRCAVIGPTGSLGSHICLELLNRGHDVVGVSRSPEKLGRHERYQPKSFDLAGGTIEDLEHVLKDVEVVVNAYNPPLDANTYKTFLEATRCIVKAVKSLNSDGKGPYLIQVGGTGSLEVPGRKHETVLDSRRWWLTLRRTVGDSAAATAHMVERIGPGPVAQSFEEYRNARLAVQAGQLTKINQSKVEQTEDMILHGPNPFPDLPLAARAALMMFEGNESFKWLFVSPPAKYRPGVKTGKYEIWKDKIPMLSTSSVDTTTTDWDEVWHNLLGISVADLAVAIVDEVEVPQKVGVHWSAGGDLLDDVPRSGYVTI